jgi:hypothetical protein
MHSLLPNERLICVAGFLTAGFECFADARWHDRDDNPRRRGQLPIELLRTAISFCYTKPMKQAVLTLS